MALPPPPRKEDQRFDNWVFTLWKRAVSALVSGGVGATSPITITTSGTGTVNIGHGTSGVVTGTYGSQSQIAIVAVDTYGHLTLATSSDVAIAGTAVTGANLTVSSPLTGTATNALLRAGTVGHGTSGVIGGTYGGALGVPRIVVDTWGHVTAGTSFPLQATAPILVGSNAGTFTWGHSTSGIVTGTYGAASVIPQVVVNTWGHVTAINTLNVAVAGTAVTGANLTVNSPLLGTVTNALLRSGAISHATSGVTGGTYGASGTVARVVVDTWGHVTGAAGVAIDHGSIAGLSDDDHPQYGLIGSSETITGEWIFSNSLIVSNTNSLAEAFRVRRTTTTAEEVINYLTDGVCNYYYTNDEAQAQFTWTVENTDTESGGGAAANTHTFEFIGGNGFATLELDNNVLWHGGNLKAASPITLNTAGTGTIAHATSGVVTGTYGGTSGIPRVIVNTYGHVTAGTTFPLQATAPITVGSNAGTFTWGHSTSGITSGTYGGSGANLQIVVNTWGHVTAASTFAADATTDYPLVKGFVPDGESVTIDDGYQLLCVGMTVFGTGTIIVEGTGILAVL